MCWMDYFWTLGHGRHLKPPFPSAKTCGMWYIKGTPCAVSASLCPHTSWLGVTVSSQGRWGSLALHSTCRPAGCPSVVSISVGKSLSLLCHLIVLRSTKVPLLSPIDLTFSRSYSQLSVGGVISLYFSFIGCKMKGALTFQTAESWWFLLPDATLWDVVHPSQVPSSPPSRPPELAVLGLLRLALQPRCASPPPRLPGVPV